MNIEIPKSNNWQIVRKKMKGLPSGIQDVSFVLKDSDRVEIDWIRFE